MKHALVTGAGGFIGRRLCAQLTDAGIEVTALHRRSRTGPWAREVLCDLALGGPHLEAIGSVDTVFHLAGHAHAEDRADSAELHRRISVDGTSNLLRELGPHVSRLIYFSTVKAMGESTSQDCIDESVEPLPTTVYGRSRLEAEGLVLKAGEQRAVSVLRLPLVFGPGSRGNLARMLRAAAAGRLPLLPDFDNRRSTIHVDDVCNAALRCARSPATRSRVYLLAGGRDHSTREIQELVFEAVGRRVPGWTIPRAALSAGARVGDVLRVLGMRRPPLDSQALVRLSGSACYRSERARFDFGFVPSHTLREGLAEMYGELCRETLP